MRIKYTLRGVVRLRPGIKPAHRLHFTKMSGPLTPQHGITFHVTYKIDPSNVDKFVSALRPAWEAIAKEPECIYFDVFRSASEPGTFRLVEVWNKDSTWIEDNHLTKDHYKQYREVTESMVVKRDLEVFERLQNWSVVRDAYLKDSVRVKA